MHKLVTSLTYSLGHSRAHAHSCGTLRALRTLWTVKAYMHSLYLFSNCTYKVTTDRRAHLSSIGHLFISVSYFEIRLNEVRHGGLNSLIPIFEP